MASSGIRESTRPHNIRHSARCAPHTTPTQSSPHFHTSHMARPERRSPPHQGNDGRNKIHSRLIRNPTLLRQSDTASRRKPINGERLTGQYDACIRYHINGYHLRQYLQDKNGWSDFVWTEIDFTTFGNHFRRMTPSNQVLYMKVVHNQLPLGDRRLRQSLVQEESLGRCPCCQSVKETPDHFLRCGANPVHGKGIRELRSILQIAPNHPVYRILFAGVKHWLSNKDEAFTPDIKGYPKHLLPFIEIAIQSQARIGWYPALKGFLSDKWQDLASMDLFNVTKMDDQLGAYRMMQLVKKLYVVNSSMWKSRNEILHSNDSQTMAEIRSTETAEIRHYFQNPRLLAFNDRHLCEGSQDSLLKAQLLREGDGFAELNYHVNSHAKTALDSH